MANFSLSIGPDGQLSSSMRVQLSLDMAPFWLDIAIARVLEAEAAHGRVLEAAAGTDDDLLASAFEAEFTASMQAIAAAGIALDALYARIKEFAAIPPDIRRAWAEKGTARYKQLTEVFRRAFRISPRGAVILRTNLKLILSFRDTAVHPPAEARDAVHHPDVDVGTEWRLVHFRFANAMPIVRETLKIVLELLGAPPITVPRLAEYCPPALERVNALVALWERSFGPLR
jgi:hypothetical protein